MSAPLNACDESIWARGGLNASDEGIWARGGDEGLDAHPFDRKCILSTAHPFDRRFSQYVFM